MKYLVIILLSLANLSYPYIKPIKAIRPYKKGINSISISPNSRSLAVGYTNGRVSIVNISSRKVRVLGRHFGVVNDISWSYDGKYIISCSSDMTVRLWHIKTRRVQVMREHNGIVFAVASHPNRMLIASGASDNKVILWEPKNNSIKTMDIHNSSVWSLVFSPNGQFLVSAGGEGDNRIILWDYSSGKTIKIKSHNRGINSIGFSPNGRLLASASVDKYIKIWNIKKQKLIAKYRFKKSIWNAIFNPVSFSVIVSLRDRYIHRVDLKTLKRTIVYRHNTAINTITVNKSYIIFADKNGRIFFLPN